MRLIIFLLIAIHTLSASEKLGFPNGPEFEGVDEVMSLLGQQDYDLEVLISFANSSVGAAGHLALNVKDPDTLEEIVHSANFYADRKEAHRDNYNEKLVIPIPKREYLFGTSSSVSKKTKFGLDYGELFKRSVIGVRLYGIGKEKVRAIQQFYKQLNEDFQNQVGDTNYHYGKVVYNYMNLNCAKSVAQAIHFGGGFDTVKVKGNHFIGNLPLTRALFAHTPTSTALDILQKLGELGHRIDVVLYKRYEHSEFVSPDYPKIALKDMVNRFPSVKSLDYFMGSRNFEDHKNIFAMHLFYALGRYSIAINADGKAILEKEKEPSSYQEALAYAEVEAERASKNLLRRLVRSMGIRFFPKNDTGDLYQYSFVSESMDGELEFIEIAP